MGKRLDRAKKYILEHPEESKAQQALGSGVSVGTIASARGELVTEGRIAPTRKSAGGAEPPSPILAPAAPEAAALMPDGPVAKPAGMLDHDAMLAMADIADLDDLTDEETFGRLLKQCIQFAFNPKLHPDTRMSASVMWQKLRDQAKSKDLGPGSPITFEDGRDRLADMHLACGLKMVVAALEKAFPEIWIPTEGAPDAEHRQPSDEAQPTGGSA